MRWVWTPKKAMPWLVVAPSLHPDVQPDDVKFIVTAVLAHRVILTPDSRLRKVSAEQVIDDIVAEIAVPTMSQND